MPGSKAGRPKGAKNKKRLVSVVIPSSCPRCGSTNRGQYTQTASSLERAGEVDGFEFNSITWKRTKCNDCGQHRIDRIYEKK